MYYLIRIFLAVTILVIPFTTTSYAATTEENAIIQQDWITRGQQNRLEKENRIREQNAIKKERDRKKKEEVNERKKQLITSENPELCFKIKEIKLSKVKSISKKDQQKLIKPFLGKCLKEQVLSKLVSKITSAYHKKGYVAARVSIPIQNIQSGILELDILEGRIGKIILDEDSLTDKMQKFTAFGMIEGDVLNIKDINQGVYQMNRLASNKITLKVEPSSIENEAIIYIKNKQKFPARATIGYNNLGNEFTGVKRTNFSAGFDNMFFLNDNINLSYVTNLNEDSNKKDLKYFSGNFSVPFHYNTFSLNYSRSLFRGLSEGETTTIKLTGYSDSGSITWDRLLLNNGNLRISSNASITEKRLATYLNDVKIETSERNLTIGNVGFSISSYLKNGTNIYLKPSYSKGLKILDAKQDEKNVPTSTPKAQFELFKLYASISKKLTLPKINTPITLSSEMNSQFAKETLFGSEQFSVGGYYSVRGFRETYITGDSGYYLRNKANLNIGSLLAPFIINHNYGFLKNNLNHLNKFSLEPFYDYGYVKNKYDGTDGHLSGAGIKTIFSNNYFDASLSYSWAINKSQLSTSSKKENSLVYFEITSKCC